MYTRNMIFEKRYDNGLRLVVVPMEAMLSVTAGIMVGVGSCFENDSENGISHFIEHTTFKGTKRFNSYGLSSAFDDIGSQVNAFTSKETTCYYVKSTETALERSFELLSDMFLNSTYKKAELEKEKGVVIEEINMCLDTPEDLCLDNLSEAYFGNQGLGKTILGTYDNVKSFDKSGIEKFRKRFYNADNAVISFAGRITKETAEKLVEKYFLPYVSDLKSEEKNGGDFALNEGVKKVKKDIEQTHIGLAFEGIKYDDDMIDSMNVLNNVTGAGMSSRLFQKIREEMGLCYTVYSYPSCYLSTGTFAVYAGVTPESAENAVSAIFDVLKELKRNGITKEEFERGKAQTISSFAFGQESTSSQMLLYSKYLLSTDKIFDVDAKLERVKNLSIDKIGELLDRMDFERYCVSLVGKNVAD